MFITFENDMATYQIVSGDKVEPNITKIILWTLSLTFLTGFVIFLSVKRIRREKEERDVYETLRVLKEEYNIEIGEQEKLALMEQKIDEKVIAGVSQNKKMSTNMAWAGTNRQEGERKQFFNTMQSIVENENVGESID